MKHLSRSLKAQAQGQGHWSAILAMLMLAAALYLLFDGRWGEIAQQVGLKNKPVAEQRSVTARGDLSASEQSVIELFEAAKPSVAYIFTESVEGNLFTRRVAEGAGSGFIWDEFGHVVTNSHVVQSARRIQVQLDSGNTYPARLVGVAPSVDLAVVKLINPSDRDIRPIPVGQSSNLRVGQSVFAIGNPFGLSKTLTSGIVSALERNLPTDTGREIPGVIQTDAAINPGNSGGPLLDSAGRLIGVNTAILSKSGSSAGVGFAIPVDLVNKIVPQLIQNGRVPRPGIGIAAGDESITSSLGVRGVAVLAVEPGSPADRAGLRPFDLNMGVMGDIIISVNGVEVASLAQFATAVDKIGVGGEAELGVLRQGKKITLRVQIIDLQRP